MMEKQQKRELKKGMSVEPKVEVEIVEFTRKGFYTIHLILSTGECFPLGKQWKRESTAKKWAEKIKRYHIGKGYRTEITKRISKL